MSINKLLLRSAILLAAPLAAFAQAGETDAGEVAALGGGTFGIGAQPAVAGSAGTSFSRHGMALLETTYMPMGNYTIQSWPDRSTVKRSYVFDFGFDIHIRIPVGKRWEPYGIAGAGLLWNIVRQNDVDAHGVQVVRQWDQFNGALHTGAGVRYYIGENWGIRPQFKVIVSKQVYSQLMVGVFYVTPPDWP